MISLSSARSSASIAFALAMLSSTSGASRRRGGRNGAGDGYVRGIDAQRCWRRWRSPSAPEEGFRLGACKISHCLAGVEVVLAPLPGGRQEKERTPCGQRDQSVAMQTTPKFGPCLCRGGRRGQNASGRWAGFFPTPIKTDRFEHPRSVCVRPLEMS
jgi:hypothetical protein